MTTTCPANEQQSQQCGAGNADEQYQILPIDAELPLESFGTTFVNHYRTVHRDIEEAASLYLPDAIRSIEIYSSHKAAAEKKHFRNPHIIDSYDQYALKDVQVDASHVDRTEYLIYMTISGRCMFRDQNCRINLDLVQHAIRDQDSLGVSYLIAYERISINSMHAASATSTSEQSKPSFSFGSKKHVGAHSKQSQNSKIIMQNTPAAVVSRLPISKPISHHQQNGIASEHMHHFDPTISQINHHSNAASAISDHEDRFSVQSEKQHQQVSDKNFSASRMNAKSIPLQTAVAAVEQAAPKREERFNRNSYSKYSGIISNNTQPSSEYIANIMNAPKSTEETVDGEQRMPNSQDKFNSNTRDNKRSNFGGPRGDRDNNSRPQFRDNRGPRTMGNRTRGEESTTELYVINFPEETESDALKQAFCAFGDVKEVSIKKQIKNNTFYAHVKYDTPEEAKAAVAESNKMELDGQVITIKYRLINQSFDGGNRFQSRNSSDRKFNSRRGSGPNSPRKNLAGNQSSNAADKPQNKDW